MLLVGLKNSVVLCVQTTLKETEAQINPHSSLFVDEFFPNMMNVSVLFRI